MDEKKHIEGQSNEKSETNLEIDADIQTNRAILRERFLKVLGYMENKQVEIETFQGSRVSGIFRSMDFDISNMHIKNLMTPIGCVPEALLRTSDVVSIKFEI